MNMKHIIKYRTIILIVWLVAAALLTIFQPDTNAILQQRGQTPISDDSPSRIADELLGKMEATKGTNDLIVFYNENKITNEEMTQIEASVKAISDSSEELGIVQMMDPFSMPEAKSNFISEDGTTLMVAFKLDKGGQSVDEIKDSLESKITNLNIEYYLTGEDFINDDYLKSSVAGVEKSAALTVVFILVILIIMFRSVATPIISLLTVGITYLCSMGIAAQLIDKANFPVTTLTQVLLVLILFGIGTDYNILLFNRFKEELAKGLAIDEAIHKTYKTAGKTIAFSILTVFIAFLSLIFAESEIYKSGIVVVIGATVLLLEILTLTPFVMKTLGEKLFWPSKKSSGHNESKVWNKAATIATKRPILCSIVILLLIVPTIIFHQQKLNFDTVGELGESFDSAKGFYILSDHFGKGQAMPLNVVIESENTLNNNQTLTIIDELTEKIKNIDGVNKVSSATQPEGKQIEAFYVGNNLITVSEGLTQTKDGVDQIYDGMQLAQGELSSADFSQVSQMVDGTKELETGVSALADGLQQIKDGINDGSVSSENISNGLTAIESNLKVMSAGVKTLSDSYKQMQSGYEQMGSSYQSTAKALLQVKDTLVMLQNMVTALGASYTGSSTDMNYIGLSQTLNALVSSLSAITPEGMEQLDTNYNTVTLGFATANDNLEQMSSGLSQMADGLVKLENGLSQATDGIGTIVTNLGNVEDGLSQMAEGQQQLSDGLNGFGSFGDQLSQVNSGLSQISDGLNKTNEFLSELSSVKSFYIPEEALSAEDYQIALNTYMSGDRKITKLMVVLDYDPYSMDAVEVVGQVNDIVASTLKGTVLSDAEYGVSGSSATTKDMNEVLSGDLSRMIVIVLIGIFLVLLVVIRSFWASICITASLIGAYYTAIFLSNKLFIDLMGYTGLNSFIPFFAFIIIVALGVDYSIFLMVRYMEYHDRSPREGIIKACKHIGGVVTGAVIILGGTFATLIPSGLILLIELAVTVIIGLIALCVVLLPVFLPAMISMPDRMNRLFSKNDNQEVE